MKTLLSMLMAVFVLVLAAEDKLVIPKGINYKQAPAEVNSQAKKIAERLFSGKASEKEISESFTQKMLICGPTLWSSIADDKAVAGIKTGNTNFEIPVRQKNGKVVIQKKPGKLFQSPEEIMLFWKAFSKRTDFTGLKVRKLTPAEMKIHWAFIPFDITEPIFIVDSKKHKILISFVSEKSLKICWIDDYQSLIQ